MHASDLPDSPDLAPQAIPVICDKCRATGYAGDAIFSAIPDILGFTPVPRRAHVNNWTDQHQRAFIAALAITGSPRQAARAIGRHAFGAESLRNHKHGKSFAAAWDAALELARERETMRIHDSLATLAESRDVELASLSPSSPGRGGRSPQAVAGPRLRGTALPAPESFPPGFDPEFDDGERLEYLEAKMRIRERLLRARRLLLMLISSDPARRHAWEVLVGPVDWDRAERLEPQDDEPWPDPQRNPQGMPNFLQPDMLLTAEAGLLPELTGGHDAMAEIREALASAGEPKGE